MIWASLILFLFLFFIFLSLFFIFHFFVHADILRTIHSSEDTSIYEKLVNTIFDEDMLSSKGIQESVGRPKLVGQDTSSILFTDVCSANRDQVVEVATEVFRKHCAKHLEIIPMRMLDERLQLNRFHSELTSFYTLAIIIFSCYLFWLTCAFDVNVFELSAYSVPLLNLKKYCEAIDSWRRYGRALPWATLSIRQMGHYKPGMDLVEYYVLSKFNHTLWKLMS